MKGTTPAGAATEREASDWVRAMFGRVLGLDAGDAEAVVEVTARRSLQGDDGEGDVTVGEAVKTRLRSVLGP